MPSFKDRQNQALATVLIWAYIKALCNLASGSRKAWANESKLTNKWTDRPAKQTDRHIGMDTNKEADVVSLKANRPRTFGPTTSLSVYPRSTGHRKAAIHHQLYKTQHTHYHINCANHRTKTTISIYYIHRQQQIQTDRVAWCVSMFYDKMKNWCQPSTVQNTGYRLLVSI